ncbi:hypothetical protein V9T40_008126 [Parthenolecanium corni]|uniref:Trichoplein keratin filament-binding protein n=1 Tax=Parthenolecanium corni TaxID=536013 RepID=A0AAN9Y9B7_9HEMI
MEEVKVGIDRKTHRLREESLARKRNQEYHKQLFWNDITNYYKSWNVQASKYSTWASQPPTPSNHEGCQDIEIMSLKQRREKLTELFRKEEQQYAEAIREYNRHQSEAKRETRADCENDTLKLMLQEERNGDVRKISNCSQWESVHPIIERATIQLVSRPGLYVVTAISSSLVARATTNSKNRMERKKSQKSMELCWTEQIKEKKLREENEKEMMRKLEEETNRQLVLEDQKEREFLQQKQEEMKQLRNYLLTQMEEIKKTDKLARELKAQEQREIQLKMDLEEIASRRNQIERQRRTKEFRSFLRHQYQSQLKQKTKQIQEELNEDKRLIEEISRCLEQEEKKTSRVKEETRQEIDRANAMLAEYTKLEKQREREMEFIFFEEAKKMWQKQEAHWEAEKEARNKLMRDVLITIQQQVKENLQRSAEQHKTLLEEKEDILGKIEDVNNQLKSKEREAAERKKKYMADLKEQIQEKEQQKIYEKQKEENEFRQEQNQLMLEEQRILSELSSFGSQKLKKPVIEKVPHLPENIIIETKETDIELLKDGGQSKLLSPERKSTKAKKSVNFCDKENLDIDE